MGKRRGLLRTAARPHAGVAGGSHKTKTKRVAGVKPKLLKVKLPSKPASSTPDVQTVEEAFDMFSLAVPAISSLRGQKVVGKRMKGTRRSCENDIATIPAFDDVSTEDLFRSVLNSARTAPSSDLIPVDAHRAHMEEVKRQSAERRAAKAARRQSQRGRKFAMKTAMESE